MSEPKPEQASKPRAEQERELAPEQQHEPSPEVTSGPATELDSKQEHQQTPNQASEQGPPRNETPSTPVDSTGGVTASPAEPDSSPEAGTWTSRVKSLTALSGAVTALLVGLVALRDPLCQLAPALSLCPPPSEPGAGAEAANSDRASAVASPGGAEPGPGAGSTAASQFNPATLSAVPPARATAVGAVPQTTVRLTVRVRRRGVVVDGALVSAGRDQCSTLAGACTLDVALPSSGSLRLEATKGDGARTLSGALDVPLSALSTAEPSVTLELERSAGLRQDVVVRVWRQQPGTIETNDVTVQIVGGTDQQQCSTHDRGSCTLPQVDTDRAGSLELQVVAGEWSGVARRDFEALQSEPRMEITLNKAAGASSPPRKPLAPCTTESRVQAAMDSCLNRAGRYAVSVEARPGVAPRITGAGPYEACLRQALGTPPQRCRVARLGPVTLVR